MKKILIVTIAILLALPAAGYAGSVSSRWDLTIGGDVKFDLGYSDNGTGNNSNSLWEGGLPVRTPESGTTTLGTKYGADLMGGGETGLNFFIKGPDAWGAKTHAFIAADFTGFWGAAGVGSPPNNDAYNIFNLLIATMGFDWANTSLEMGVSGSFFGEIATWSNSVGWNNLNWGGKGAAPVVPQVTVTERFDKNWSAGIGIMAGYNTINQLQSPNGIPTTPNDANHNSDNPFNNPLPAFEGKIAYSSDSCGKVGPWQLLVQADGFWGEIRNIYGSLFSHTDVQEWFGDFKFLVPIIPEKNGNKTGALYADATLYAGSGGGQIGNWYANANAGGLVTGDYQRSPAADPNDWASPLMEGFYAHAQYYITDGISVNGWWVHTRTNASEAQRIAQSAAAGGTGLLSQVNQYIANVMYDVNPAVRFTLEWDGTYGAFAAPLAGYKNTGSNNAYRLSAYYFF